MAATATVQSPTTRWPPIILGILAILVGISFLASPAVTSMGFVFGLGLIWFALGIREIVRLIQDRTHWGWRLFNGVIGILAGVWILSGMLGKDHPLGTAFAVGSIFTWFLGFLGIIYGVVAMVDAFRGGGWLSAVLSIVAFLFGLAVLFNPLEATFALPVSLGIVLIAGGIVMIVGAFQMR